eukprot:scaffold57970_cov102-Attheya_sp.AAC.1
MTSLLVHILTDTDFAHSGRKFASMKIATRCVDEIIANRTLEEKIWSGATQARGVFAERLWHRAVRRSDKIRVKMLDAKENTSMLSIAQ